MTEVDQQKKFELIKAIDKRGNFLIMGQKVNTILLVAGLIAGVVGFFYHQSADNTAIVTEMRRMHTEDTVKVNRMFSELRNEIRYSSQAINNRIALDSINTASKFEALRQQCMHMDYVMEKYHYNSKGQRSVTTIPQ